MNSRDQNSHLPPANQTSESIDSSGKNALSPIRVFAILVASIFGIELLIMVVFLLAPPLPDVVETFVDATALTLLVAPILYRFAIVPLFEYIASLRQLTENLEQLNNTLELRVAERTALMDARTSQLQTVSSVARKIASIQDLDALLPEITELVSKQFNFYHSGIFLLDESDEYAVLKAANSEGGKVMLSRQHKLKADGNSIVGYVISRGEPRIALDVGADAVFFNNPDLPTTRSEMALPLRFANRIIGALDVQSLEPNAFTTADIETLTTLADQVAIAIENARLFSEAKQALDEAEKTFESYVKKDWNSFANQAKNTGYLFDGNRITPMDAKDKHEKVKSLSKTGRLSLEKGSHDLTIPIKFRGQTIGFLDVKSKNGIRQWTQDEITLLEAAAERAAFALENARLVESAQRRALRERSIGEISAKISAASDMDAIMQAAVEELGRRIGGTAEVSLELEAEEK